MSDTKLISARLRIPLIEYLERCAEAEKRSRSQILSLIIEAAKKGGVNGGSGVNSVEAGNNSWVDERGVGRGIKEPDAGTVRAGGLRAASGGGGGAVAGKEKGAKKTVASKISEEATVSGGWFPNSMCPHGYQNSFACEKNNGGCTR